MAEQKDDLLAGKTPRTKPEGLVLRELLDRYVVAQRERVDGGEIAARPLSKSTTPAAASATCWTSTASSLTLAPTTSPRCVGTSPKSGARPDWERSSTGSHFFKFGYDSRLIDRPFRSARVQEAIGQDLAAESGQEGTTDFDAEQLRAIIDEAGRPGESDGAAGRQLRVWQRRLCQAANWRLDLQAGWVTFPRPKTGIQRRIPLWPETVAALRWPSLSGRSRRTRPMPRSCSLRSMAGRGTNRPLRIGKDGKFTIANIAP